MPAAFSSRTADVDHIGGVAALAEGTGVEVWAPSGEVERAHGRARRAAACTFLRTTPSTLVGGGDEVSVAGITFDVVDVPGHSAGHIAFYADGHLFSGDLLFAGSVGRVDLPGGDWDTLLASVRALLDRFPGDTIVHPGHGPATTLERELRTNPFLRDLRAESADGESFQAPRGTHDVLPGDANWWGLVARIEETLRRYGWRRIQTPGFEDTALFARTSGDASDVVHKEMYTFEDRSDRSLTLRPEGTAPIARAYVEHGLHREPQPVKAYTIAPMYRYGRPGRGRYREHYQVSVEAIGSADPAIDAEVIEVYTEILRQLGVTQWELHLNSIGDAACRPAYVERARTSGSTRTSTCSARKRCTSARRARCRSSTSRIQRCAPRSTTRRRSATRSATTAARTSPRSVRSSTGSACRTSLDPALVRGLDYYTRTTFEFMGPEENANSVICGGGRYDGLVEQIGGPADARASGSAPASSGCCSRSRTRASRSSRRARRVRRRRRGRAARAATRSSRSCAAPGSRPTWTSPAVR